MLVICPTPIGNLEDITVRQRAALAGADIIACEDTRRTGKLLELLGIARVDGRPKLWRYDDHSGIEALEGIIGALERGAQITLVSDAGTPTISDPGYRLVRACRERGVRVETLPGPVAALVALSGSGLPTDRFFFAGFLPSSSGERIRRLEELDERFGDVTVVLYESPKRIVETLGDLENLVGGSREVALARELTKIHEEFLVGPLKKVRTELEGRGSVKGEIVLCIGPAGPEKADLGAERQDEAIRLMLREGLRARTIKELMSGLFEMPRSAVYARIEALKEETGD